MSTTFPHTFLFKRTYLSDVLTWCNDQNQIIFRDYLVVHLNDTSTILFKHGDVAMLFKLAHG